MAPAAAVPALTDPTTNEAQYDAEIQQPPIWLDLNCLDEQPDEQFPQYFLKYLPDIFQWNVSDILDKLEARSSNGKILKNIRMNLLKQANSMFTGVPVKKAKKRKDNWHLICSDITKLAYCVLNNNTYQLFTLYSSTSRQPTKKTEVGTASHTPADQNQMQHMMDKIKQIELTAQSHHNESQTQFKDLYTKYTAIQEQLNQVKAQYIKASDQNAQKKLQLTQLKNEVQSITATKESLAIEVALLKSMQPAAEGPEDELYYPATAEPEEPPQQHPQSTTQITTPPHQQAEEVHQPSTPAPHQEDHHTPMPTATHTALPQQQQQQQQQVPPSTHTPPPNAPTLSNIPPALKFDKIFLNGINHLITEKEIKDDIHRCTKIDKDLIWVKCLFTKDGNKAFRVTVPEGKRPQTMKIWDSKIEAAPYKEPHHKHTTHGQPGQSRRPNYSNSSRSHGTFRGPRPSQRPRPNRPNRPHYQGTDNSNWGSPHMQNNANQRWDYYQHPEQQYYHHYQQDDFY